MIKFIKSYFTETKRVPSIQIISDNIAGVNRSNFYNLFSGIGEACDLAGVPRPSKRMNSTKKASKKRREKKPEIPHLITLTEEQTRNLLGIEFFEKKPALDIIDELFDNLRFVKIKYEVNLSNIGVFSKFLKEAEKSGLGRAEIINCMHILTGLGVANAKSPVFNLFVNLVKYFLNNDIEITDLGSILKSKKVVFMDGYNRCIGDSEKIIIDALPRALSSLECISVAKRIQSKLLFNLHEIGLTVE